MKCPVCNGRGGERFLDNDINTWAYEECFLCYGTGKISFVEYVRWKFYTDWNIPIIDSRSEKHKLYLTDIWEILWYGKVLR